MRFSNPIKKSFIILFVLLAVSMNLSGQAANKQPAAPNNLVWKAMAPEGCPFPKSTTLTGIAFTGLHSDYQCGDTWYPFWASDDNLYSPWTDGKTEGIECASCWMNGAAAYTGHAVMIGDDPLKLSIKNTSKPKLASALPYGGRYPAGSLVYNGIWYYGTYCLNACLGGQLKHNGFAWAWPTLGPMPGFQISRDYGKTWEPSPLSPEKPLFPEPRQAGGPVKMGAPHFVDFGKNLQYSPDGKAYLLAQGAEENDPLPRPCLTPGTNGMFQVSTNCPDKSFAHGNLSWISADQVYLARVTPSPETINDIKAYEFFAGHDANRKPIWTNDFTKIKPLLDWNNHMGCVTATYVPSLKKYLMCVTDGWPTVAKMTSYILESDAITGPWKMVSYMKDFGEQAYFLNFPSKFISADGKTLWLCYSANFNPGWNGVNLKTNPTGGRYGLCLHEVKRLTPDKRAAAAKQETSALAGPSAETFRTGFAAMEHPENLPCLPPNGTMTRQVNSYDTSGGNADGKLDEAWNRYTAENGEWVIFDEVGPGCLYRQQMNVWFPMSCKGPLDPTARIKYYFDDEKVPRLDMTFDQFFGKNQTYSPPFTPPLVLFDNFPLPYHANRFAISYYPFPFKKRLTIIMTPQPRDDCKWFQYTGIKYPTGTAVASWSGKKLDSPLVRKQWDNLGTDPKDTAGNVVVSTNLTIAAGESVTAVELKGQGSIASLRFAIEPYSRETLFKTTLAIYWDDQATPSVEMPLGSFFAAAGSGYPAKKFQSLFLGFDAKTRSLYSYWPMPYWSSARIVLTNHSGAPITLLNARVEYKPVAALSYSRERTGYFHAKRTVDVSLPGAPYSTAMVEQGWGRVVGIFFDSDGYAMDGDEFVYMDDSLTPQIHGSGTEDDHDQGWGGDAYQKALWGGMPNGFQGGYRYYMNDSYLFNRNIRITYEHSDAGGKRFEQKTDSIVYYYKADGIANLSLSDSLDVGNAGDEKAHHYNLTGATWTGSVTCAYDTYEQAPNHPSITDDGRAFKGSSCFTVRIDPKNQGVLLRRRCNRHMSRRQVAEVQVDGKKVSEFPWYVCELATPAQTGWLDTDYFIPASLTAGKQQITVKVKYLDSCNPEQGINEFHYWVYSYGPAVERTANKEVSDSQSAPDVQSINYARVCEPQIKPVFLPLPPGAVEPAGWLRDWALAARDGISGHLDEHCAVFRDGWKGAPIKATEAAPDGTGWPIEQCAYWLDGALRLGFVLHDEALIKKIRGRLDPIVDGVNKADFGTSFIYWKKGYKPEGFNSWAHSHMGRALVGLYQGTGDNRVLDALVKVYADYPTNMGKTTFHDLDGLCNLDAMLETYSMSGDRRIFDRALKIISQPTVVTNIEEWSKGIISPGHMVILYENARLPALTYPWTSDSRQLQATLNVLKWLDDNHVLPYGVASGEEYASGIGAFRKTETCDVTAMLHTSSWMYRIQGNGDWGDRMERAFFNAGPGPVSRDFKTMSYYQSPNRLRSDSLPHESPKCAWHDGLTFSPLGRPWILCCVGAVNRIIPSYIIHSWMATRDNGLAATLYGPCTVSALAGARVPVKVTTRTDYPFDETIHMKVTTEKDVAFPLYLRIPGWCKRAQIAVNGVPVRVRSDDKGFVKIVRIWSDGDTIELRFPMEPRVVSGFETEFPSANRQYYDYEPESVFQPRRLPYASVLYGPLLFSLSIPDVNPNTPAKAAKWQYALDIDACRAGAGIRVERKPMPAHWDWPLNAPLTLTAPARGFDWKPTDAQALPSEAVRGGASETIRLVPYGCTKFRISMFPEAALVSGR